MIIIITLLALFVGFLNLLAFGVCKSIPQWERDISDKEQEKFLREWRDKK